MTYTKVMEEQEEPEYPISLTSARRLPTIAVRVGGVTIGGGARIAIQSMTTTDTLDVAASVEQILSLCKEGCEIVRLTTQTTRHAAALRDIKERLRERQCDVPLVADVHYNPEAALEAAKWADAVRINPGNYLNYKAEAGEAEADAEFHRLLVEKLQPLVERLRERPNTALRIGVNYGSLSERITRRYGDTPEGVIRSCIEYLEALEELDWRATVISVKSSSTATMVRTVRRLVAQLNARGTLYPLHLGVTEAGRDLEGRLKSFAGIGALLADGIGDTIRVSLTEAPEQEVRVARELICLEVGYWERFQYNHDYPWLAGFDLPPDVVRHIPAGSLDETALRRLYSPYSYHRRPTEAVCGIGGQNPPIVLCPGFGLSTRPAPTPPGKVHGDWLIHDEDVCLGPEGQRLVPATSATLAETEGPVILMAQPGELADNSYGVLDLLRQRHDVVVMLTTGGPEMGREMRAAGLLLESRGIRSPLVLHTLPPPNSDECIAGHLALPLLDGVADGIFIAYEFDIDGPDPASHYSGTNVAFSYGMLQAVGLRTTRTEFVSCPGCGRTLYDIQSVSGLLKERLGELPGVKIAVMGCIVNGLGEMADAHYAYVGAAAGEVALYRLGEKVCGQVPQGEALERLVQLVGDDQRRGLGPFSRI